jgi:hypothetical protein
MPARKTLTAADILPFIPRLKNRELTRAELAKELGVCLPTLRRELKNIDLEVPHKRNRVPLRKRLVEIYTQEELETYSQYKMAKDLNVTQPHIARALKTLGIKRSVVYDNSERDALCEQVVDYILENGGYVVPTIRKLGLKLYKNAVYDYCKERQIDLEPYRFAYRRYGYWLTLPGIPERRYAADYRVKAECTRCGSIHQVSIINLRTGASTQCRACSNEDKRDRSCCKAVVCLETKEKIRSVRELSKRLDISYSSLSTVLKRDGCFTRDGLTYQLDNWQGYA